MRGDRVKWFKRRSSRADLMIAIATLTDRITALKTEHSTITQDLVNTVGREMSNGRAMEALLTAGEKAVEQLTGENADLKRTMGVVVRESTMILDEVYAHIQGAHPTHGVGRNTHRITIDVSAWHAITNEVTAALHLTSDPVPDLVVWHRGRGWEGHDLEDSCPCPQEECGLIASTTTTGDCPQHGFAAAKTLRQSHRATDCPGATP